MVSLAEVTHVDAVKCSDVGSACEALEAEHALRTALDEGDVPAMRRALESTSSFPYKAGDNLVKLAGRSVPEVMNAIRALQDMCRQRVDEAPLQLGVSSPNKVTLPPIPASKDFKEREDKLASAGVDAGAQVPWEEPIQGMVKRSTWDPYMCHFLAKRARTSDARGLYDQEHPIPAVLHLREVYKDTKAANLSLDKNELLDVIRAQFEGLPKADRLGYEQKAIDTIASYDQAFDIDWARINGNGGRIWRALKVEDEEVMGALKDAARRHYPLLVHCFYHYATMDQQAFTIGANEWHAFYTDAGLTDEERARSEDLDRAMFASNFESDGSSEEGKLNPDKLLVRFEFLDLVIRAAHLRLRCSAAAADSPPPPGEALRQVCEEMVAPRVPAESPDTFRALWYIEEVSAYLMSRHPALRSAFRFYRDVKGRSKRLPIEGWLKFLEDGGVLRREGVTQGQARRSFIYSRMLVTEGFTEKEAVVTLGIVDFFEALCRAAAAAAPPTDAAIAALGIAEAADGGWYGAYLEAVNSRNQAPLEGEARTVAFETGASGAQSHIPDGDRPLWQKVEAFVGAALAGVKAAHNVRPDEGDDTLVKVLDKKASAQGADKR
mmetsp:Transcript_53352/g.169600  ORF Transcript_53352/g.169600 Transcript_53352/m.169600 type:complete len:607 (+) Transcript_53352:203-2023(+)